jgi:uncharacterized protein (DUF2249 family)
VNIYELRDLPLNGGKFTWSNIQADPNLDRLDRILISKDWENLFPLSKIRNNPRILSDHNPLILCSELEVKKNTKQFSFETAWVSHPDYLAKVTEIWVRQVSAKNVVDKWCIKINRVKKFLKGWGQNIKGHSKKHKKILKEELMNLEKMEEERSLSATLLERKTQIQTELLRMLEEEELYLHKRSNLNWLLKGDSNTNFFHRYANGKKRKNLIFNMERGDATIQGEEILAHATDYYKNLFGPSEKPLFNFNLDSDCWAQEERVTEEDNEQLTKPFSIEELKKAVNSMERNTAPGPDHIPVEFYQSGWEIIKTDLFDLLNEFCIGIRNWRLGDLIMESLP